MLRTGRFAWGLLGVAGVAVLLWFVVSRLAVIVAVTVGATLLGVLGPFLAVPVAACIARAFSFLRERQAKDGRDDDFRHREAAVPDGRAVST